MASGMSASSAVCSREYFLNLPYAGVFFHLEFLGDYIEYNRGNNADNAQSDK